MRLKSDEYLTCFIYPGNSKIALNQASAYLKVLLPLLSSYSYFRHLSHVDKCVEVICASNKGDRISIPSTGTPICISTSRPTEYHTVTPPVLRS